MRTKSMALVMLLAILIGLIGAAPVAAQGPDLPEPDPIDVGARLRSLGPDKVELDASGMTRLARPAAAQDFNVGDSVTGLVYDDYYGRVRVRTFTVRAVTDLVEVWVADNLSWPAGDPRPTPVVTQEQAEYMAQQFTDIIYPTDTDFFGTPNEYDGADAPLAEMLGLDPNYYAGTKTIIMVTNVMDDQYYDSTYPFYIAGFYWDLYEYYFNRNIINIDSYEWENRLGPDDAPWRGPDPSRWRPYLYDGTVAHEFQHLIHADNDYDEELWVNEGMSDFAEWLCGYGHPDGHVNFFRDHAENSLVMWGDQEAGEPEILADYGVAYMWTLYLYEHFGGGPFIQAIAKSESNGIASVNEQLAAFGYRATFTDVFRDFRVALLIDAPKPFRMPYLPHAHFGRVRNWVHPYEFKNIDFNVNVDTEEAYSEPGAPPWGTDYIKITDANRLKVLKFDGADVARFDSAWTAADDPLNAGNAVLWSDMGDEIDHWAIFEAPGGGTLTLDTYYDIEEQWDFGFVQVSTDGGTTWTSLANQYTVDEPIQGYYPKVVENLPGLTGATEDWVTMSFDLSAYAGQTILIAFRYVTDWSTAGYGWYVDNVYVDETLISDGSSAEPFLDITEVAPIDLDFKVTLVGVYTRSGRTYYDVRNMYINDATEKGRIYLAEVIRKGGYAVMLVTLESPPAWSNFYGQYDYTIKWPWQ